MALNGSALAEGVRGGIALSLAVILLALLGLTPSLRWIPEVPLIVAAIAVPVAGYALTGYRAGRRSGRMAAGALAGAVAGCISGAVGGIAYVLFGKPLLNIVVGLLLGAVAGGVIGAGGGGGGRRFWGGSRRPDRRPGLRGGGVPAQGADAGGLGVAGRRGGCLGDRGRHLVLLRGDPRTAGPLSLAGRRRLPGGGAPRGRRNRRVPRTPSNRVEGGVLAGRCDHRRGAAHHQLVDPAGHALPCRFDRNPFNS